MLGWQISVFRQKDAGDSPATLKSPTGKLLVEWPAGFNGLGWLDDLVKEGKAVDLGGDGYPLRYTATAEHLLPHLVDRQPRTGGVPVFGEAGAVSSGWEGRGKVDRAAIADCRPEEWLLVEAYDQS